MHCRHLQMVLVVLSILNAVAITQSENVVKNVLRKEAIASIDGDQQQQQQQLVEHNFLFGIASLGAVYENQTQCGKELEIMLKAITKNEVWGLKGAIICVFKFLWLCTKTFTWGNYFWFGTPDLCDDLNQPFTISLSHSKPPIFNATSPFPMQFVIVYLNFTTPFYIDLKLPFENLIHLGLCLPKSCSLTKIRSYADEYFQGEYFQMQRIFKLKLKALEIKAPRFSWKYFTMTGSLLIIIIFTTTNILGIVSDLVYKQRNNLSLQHVALSKRQTDARQTDDIGVNIDHHMSRSHSHNHSQQRKTYLWEELLMCFRFSVNFKTVMSLENSNSNSSSAFITVMAGMRSIVCLWITVFHVYYYSLFAISNTPFIFAKLETFPLQPILQACFYVDIFFIMSSFLLVYNFLSNTKLLQQIFCSSWWGILKMFMRSLVQRYMRLTPVMIVTMILSTVVSDFLNIYSPFRLAENSGFYCKTNWWYNLLYIHNLLDMNSICCSWTWYLACEIQYFILFTGLLFVYVKKPIAAKIVFVTLALGFVVGGWLSNFANGITFEVDVIYSTLNQLYVKPWVRIPPYLGGATMGWLMHTLQQRHQYQQNKQQQQQHQQQQQDENDEQQYPVIRTETHLQAEQQYQRHHNHHHQHSQHQQSHNELFVGPFARKTFWFLCLVLYATTNFMSYWRSAPTWAVATIMSLGKFFFALCIGGIIIIIYMLAPVIVVAMYGLRNEPTNFTEVGSGADFVSVIVLSIASAFIMMMLIEVPMQRITNRLLRKKKKPDVV
ncbi:hypothetical protein DOY81_008030 [Sarcophaga bullata]|nr:hypothetical protein DOY81_008030 [Sarcophaga bullata]